MTTIAAASVAALTTKNRQRQAAEKPLMGGEIGKHHPCVLTTDISDGRIIFLPQVIKI